MMPEVGGGVCNYASKYRAPALRVNSPTDL